MLEEWIVTLYKREDLDSFYEDMETPGGNLFIPDRVIDVDKRRPISRNTHYMLTQEEAMQIRNDPRVWDVELARELEESIEPDYILEDKIFDRSSTSDSSHINWGLLRHCEETNREGWGQTSNTSVQSNLTITASGKNVDVLIVDGHIDPNHPEFAVNSDGSGGSRIIQYNWFQNDVGFGTANYVYPLSYVDPNNSLLTSNNNHGTHVAGTVAGNTQGWARDANIYNIDPYSTNPNRGVISFSILTMWDYIRAWHNNKPINAQTGRKNPTITNNSYGSSITLSSITRVNYRGVTFDPGRTLTTAELQERGFYTSNTSPKFPYYLTSVFADIQDAIDDGIIIVKSAGNTYWKIVQSDDQDYNNIAYDSIRNREYYIHRGDAFGSSYSPVIVVGALDNSSIESKASFSNCGSAVDIFAAGRFIQSSHLTLSSQDPRNSNYFLYKWTGTSMASPQVTGVLACLAESWPNITQSEAQNWITTNGIENEMYDSGADNAMDITSLQGAPNRILYWFNQRSETGDVFPQKNFKSRLTSGMLYPRSRIRKKG